MKLPSDDKKGTAPLDEEGLWDANDVARFLKASRSWVYQRAQAGQLPCVKIGGLLRFEPAAIRAFIKGQGRC
ncbi:helix-turn-helix domain-containing protein [Myxococcus sp. XM-1-1-1]|uniref:helix-turn-helix domain-containing protein n=1 Tax=Myxococcus sp. XM-1-1-1 TaxID=2874602 RepID=UPI001CC00BD8|nr:helix-turn-helix domain-containing protein [Myxococcus sp. XM-1-1-1]MBZ4414342.1 helix-turn-helix domain-containing protein [Myxococcus sp. XM-1-1-1]